MSDIVKVAEDALAVLNRAMDRGEVKDDFIVVVNGNACTFLFNGEVNTSPPLVASGFTKRRAVQMADRCTQAGLGECSPAKRLPFIEQKAAGLSRSLINAGNLLGVNLTKSELAICITAALYNMESLPEPDHWHVADSVKKHKRPELLDTFRSAVEVLVKAGKLHLVIDAFLRNEDNPEKQ